jgi:hypothetical protein
MMNEINKDDDDGKHSENISEKIGAEFFSKEKLNSFSLCL